MKQILIWKFILYVRNEIIKWKSENYEKIIELSFVNGAVAHSNENLLLIQKTSLFVLKSDDKRNIQALSNNLTEKKECLKLMINQDETLALIGI